MRIRALFEGAGPFEPFGRAWRSLRDEEIPVGVGWTRVFGAVLLFLLGLQLLTGLLLAIDYSPSTETAWESVRFIETQVLFGPLIRGIHHWAASAFIVVLALHLGQVFLSAGYKKPRQATWIFGALLLLVGLGFGYTGYLLPWDLRAYFGTKVGTEIPGSVPVIGPPLMRLLRGGDEVGPLTLTRFFAAHAVLLPIVVLLLVAVHLMLVRRYGIAPAGTRVGATPSFAGRFYPRQLARDGTAILVAAAIVFALAQGLGAPLEAKADPSVTTYVPSPDWYFLGLQELLRLFTGRLEILGTFVLPNLFLVLLLLTPFLDRSPERAPTRRPLAVGTFVLVAACVCGLTIAGAESVLRERTEMARRASAGSRLASTGPLEISNPVVVGGMNRVSALRCDKCHSFQNTGRDGIPPLGFEGSRVRREWLYDYLRHPWPIRWLKPGVRPPTRMPDFHLNESEVASSAEYLLTLTDTNVVPDEALPSLPRDAAAAERGHALFKQAKCNGCHEAAGAGEQVGPDLSHAGRRLRPEFIAAMIKNPKSIVPDTVMQVPPDLTDREIADLVAFVESQR